MGRVVGLDIGATAVRGVEVRTRRGTSTIVKSHSVALPPGAVVNGQIEDTAAVTAALKELRAKGRFRTRNASVGIANSDLIIRLVDVDWVAPDEARSALRYEMDEYIDIGEKDVTHDVHVIRDYEVEEQGRVRKRMKAVLTAGETPMLTMIADAVAASGFRPVRMDASPLALIRGSVVDPADPTAEALVNLGASLSTVSVHVGGQPVYVRPLPGVGGEAVTQAILARYPHWSREEAESTKVALGLPVGLAAVARPSFSVFASQPSEPTDDVHEASFVIAEEMERVLMHVRESIEHAQMQERVAVSRVVLSGGTGQMHGLADRLGSELGVPVGTAKIGLGGANGPDMLTAASTLVVAAGLGAE